MLEEDATQEKAPESSQEQITPLYYSTAKWKEIEKRMPVLLFLSKVTIPKFYYSQGHSMGSKRETDVP